MPIEYPGGGVLKEHAAVRTAVGIFDVSHLGKAAIRGTDAAAFVQRTLSNDLGRIQPGRAQYTLCRRRCIGWRGRRPDPVPAQWGRGVPGPQRGKRLRGRWPPRRGCTGLGRGRRPARGVRRPGGAGPDAVLELLSAVGIATGHDYMSFVETGWQGRDLIVCRTGYTGEHGYELAAAMGRRGRPVGRSARRGEGLRRPAVRSWRSRHAPHRDGISRSTVRTCPLTSHPFKPDSGGLSAGRSPRSGAATSSSPSVRPAHVDLLRGLEATDRGIPRPHMMVRGTDGAS